MQDVKGITGGSLVMTTQEEVGNGGVRTSLAGTDSMYEREPPGRAGKEG